MHGFILTAVCIHLCVLSAGRFWCVCALSQYISH